MEISEKAGIIHELFVNRIDVHARYINKKDNRGKPIKWRPMRYTPEERSKGNPEYRPLDKTKAVINHIDHTYFKNPKYTPQDTHLGMYSADAQGLCKWCVIDFDDKSGQQKEYLQKSCQAVCDILGENGISYFLEKSRSSTGIHVWILFQEKLHSGVALNLMEEVINLATAKLGQPLIALDKIPRVVAGYNEDIPQLCGLPLSSETLIDTGGTAILLTPTGPVSQDGWSILSGFTRGGRNAKENQLIAKAIEKFESYDSVTYAEEARKARERKGDTQGYWGLLGQDSSRLETIRDCEAIKASIKNPNQFDNFTWMGILSNLAVFGEKGRTLAHEVSRKYDRTMIDNDSTKIYSEDETDKTFYNKLDWIQRGGTPTSCKRMIEDGTLKCSKYKKCASRMIATFGAEASMLWYNGVSNLQNIDEVRKLEQQGLYKRYRDILPASEYCQILIQEDQETGKPKWIGVPMTDLRILEHLTGVTEMRVRTTEFEENTTRSIYQHFLITADADVFEDTVKNYRVPIDYVRTGNEFWLLADENVEYKKAINVVRVLMKAASLKVEDDLHNIAISPFGQIYSDWVTAPFFDNLEDSIIIFDLQ